MELSYPLGTARRVSQEKIPQKPYNKFFIDQACSVKMAAFFFLFVCFFVLRFLRTATWFINTQKKELGQYPARLTSHSVSNTYIHNISSENHLYTKKICTSVSF